MQEVTSPSTVAGERTPKVLVESGVLCALFAKLCFALDSASRFFVFVFVFVFFLLMFLKIEFIMNVSFSHALWFTLFDFQTT